MQRQLICQVWAEAEVLQLSWLRGEAEASGLQSTARSKASVLSKGGTSSDSCHTFSLGRGASLHAQGPKG